MDKIEKWFNQHYQRLVDNTNKITRNEERTFDILHECVISFLQQPTERQHQILENGKVENFITSCVNIQWKSSTSPYHTKYRKRQIMEVEYLDWAHLDIPSDDEDYYNECVECIMKELNDLHFYYRTLLTDKFIKGMTYQELHNYYGISKNSLLKDVKVGVEILKQKCITK